MNPLISTISTPFLHPRCQGHWPLPNQRPEPTWQGVMTRTLPSAIEPSSMGIGIHGTCWDTELSRERREERRSSNGINLRLWFTLEVTVMTTVELKCEKINKLMNSVEGYWVLPLKSGSWAVSDSDFDGATHRKSLQWWIRKCRLNVVLKPLSGVMVPNGSLGHVSSAVPTALKGKKMSLNSYQCVSIYFRLTFGKHAASCYRVESKKDFSKRGQRKFRKDLNRHI